MGFHELLFILDDGIFVSMVLVNRDGFVGDYGMHRVLCSQISDSLES